MLKTIYLFGLGAMFGAISLVIMSTASDVVVIGWGLVVGVLVFSIVRFLDAQSDLEPNDIAPMLVAGGSLMASWIAALAIGSRSTGWIPGVAAVVGTASAWLVDVATGTAARSCFVCKTPAQPPTVTCPRCHQLICSKPTCWVPRHIRCKLCDDREVVLFPRDERWWEARLGPRITVGSCTHCMKDASESDLRSCGQCGWTYCKRCWDLHNGQCEHCDWILPDPPKVLWPFLQSVQPPAASSQR